MKTPLQGLRLLLLLTAAGCGTSDRPEPPPDGEIEASLASAADDGPGRDLSTVNVCELVSAEAIAEAMGGGTVEPAADYDPGFGGKGCRYGTRVSGYTRYAEVTLLPPGEFEAKRQMRSGKYHDLEGLGDAAWWKHRVDRTEVNVLERGVVMLVIAFQERAAATREEESRRLAQTVLEEVQ